MAQLLDVYWVNPKSIKYGSRKTFNLIEDKGKIIDGDWDLEKPIREISKSSWLLSTHERIIDDINWCKTSIYKKGLESINLRGKWGGHKSEESLCRRFKRLETLLQSIKKNGYLINPLQADVSVNIGRNGEIRFNDGIHRLCIAKVLKLDKIPIQIVVRHPKWIEEADKIGGIINADSIIQSLTPIFNR